MRQREANPHAAYSVSVRYRMTGQPEAWRPALEVYETATALIVRAELAGVDPEQFGVALDGDTLTIQGQRLPAQHAGGDAPAERRPYHEMGIPYGKFHARVRLPFPVERDGIEADYEHGFLTVLLPRAARTVIHAEHADEGERMDGMGDTREETN